MKKRIYLVLIVFSAVLFTIYIGVFIIRLPFPENILLIFFLFIVCGVSLWIIFIYTAIDRYRKLVFKDQHSRIYYVGRKYDDNILIERLERWNNSRYELGDDKKSEHLNKSIYKLEERVRKLFKKAKYQDALVITEQIFKIVKENYDRSHPFFILTVTNIGKLYQQIGNYAEARYHLENALEVRKELTGENNLDVAQSMTSLGKLYQEIGNYAEARYHLEKALEVRKELLGENNLDVAQIMTSLGKLYQEIGNYAEAELFFAKSLEIKQNFPDKYQIRTAIDYTYFGYLYYEKGEYDKAQEYYNYALKIWKAYQNYKMYPLESAATVNNLGILYQKIGNLRDAEIYLKKGLEMREKLLGENHLDVSQSRTNLAKLYHEMEDYNKANSLYGTSLNTISSNIGKDNIFFATLLTYEGKLYHDQINYNKAESLQKESLDILQKLQGINPLHIAQSMTNLGKLYHDIGNLRDAEIYLKKGLEMREKLLGENHLDSAQSKNDLAEVYLNIGDYTKAEEYHKRALEIRVKIFTRLKNTPEGLNNLANIHQQLGNNSDAIKLYKKSLGMWKKIGQKKSSGYASALHNLGELYYELRDFSKSEKYFNQALKIRLLIFDRDTSPPVAQSMNYLALLFQRMHEYAKAEEYYKQALNILKKVFGEKNINLAITLNNLAILYAETQRQDKAIELVKDVITIEDELIGKVFSIGSERQRMAFLNIINKNFHNFLSLTNQYFSNSKEEIKYAVNLTIRRKGIGAEVLTATRDAVLSGKYPEMESELRELNIIRKQIARKALDGKDENEKLETHNKILEEWNNRKENLEEELANHIPEIGLEQKLKVSSLETISKYLSTDTVLIELVKFNFTDFSNQSNNSDENNKRFRYLAFVIYGNTTNDIQMIDLGDSELIDDKINKFRNSVTGENQNRNLILVGSYPKSCTSNSKDMEDLIVNLNPLIKVIENYKRIFIAPDGDFTKFPFELLRFDSSSRYILEDCLISYITTSRDLIIFNNSSITNETHNNSLVIADPDFDLSTSDIQNNNIPTNSIFSSAIPQSNSQNNKSSFRQSRDFDSRSLNFSRLKGTREEGQVIAELIGVTPCMDQKVLESEIKSHTSPNILHIATHGFFLPNQKNRNTANIMNIATMKTNPFSRLSGDNLDNPMLRSGLALAGVNTWLKNRPLIKEAEDGILTAEDVAGWNLFNTELVVLSACETGLGDIVTGEGVFGLRRAFVLAGAQTLVMSLWKVPDEQTKELMVNFYKHLLSGKPRAEALREAQLSMKEKYPDPYYWGAFICQGNPAPLSKTFSQNS